ncbi:MAG: hypothetical protein ACPLY9_00130 [Nitrososphaerales archaeon]
MVKVKTSIYTDKELWEKYRANVAKKGIDVSQALEEVIREELIEDLLDEAIGVVDEALSYEIDFEPVKPKEGIVSVFVRAMRDERVSGVS